jgi:hypothetical protein
MGHSEPTTSKTSKKKFQHIYKFAIDIRQIETYILDVKNKDEKIYKILIK